MDDIQQNKPTDPQLTQPTQEQLLTALSGQAYDNISMDTSAQRDGLTQLMDHLVEHSERPSTGGTTIHREPRIFNGQADQLESFLREINNSIHLQRHSPPTDHNIIIYSVST